MGRAHLDQPAKRGRPPKIKRSKRVKEKKDIRIQEKESIRGQELSEGETLDCRVLLTRLEEKGVVGSKNWGRRGRKKSCNTAQAKTKPCKSRQKTLSASQHAPEPKSNQSKALCSSSPDLEPRRRRMASLNAEAFNSLLLHRHRQDSSGLILTKKQPSTSRLPIGGLESKNCSKTKKPDSGSPQKSKRAKMEEVGFDLTSLTSPTPRRQAGLMAAALLRLSSTPRGARQRSGKSGGESKEGRKQAHSKLQKQQVGHQRLPHLMLVKRCCGLCETECTQEAAQRSGPSEGQRCLLPGPWCHGKALVGSSLKPLKEEPADKEVTPTSYSCCSSQGRCTELCHCLAFLMDQRRDQEPEEHSPSKGYPLHRHSPHALAYPALAIGPHTHPHPHLHPCFTSYFIHLTHHDPSSPLLSASPLPYSPTTVTPITLCPEGLHSQRLLPKTDPEPWLQPQPQSQSSGIPQPIYCPTVGVCYSEACRTSCYTYTAVPAITSRGYCHHADCLNCSLNIKTEDFSSSPLEACSARPSACSASRPLSSCPLPTVPPAAQSIPHLQTPLSDPNQPETPLQVGRECPQSAKAPSGSRSGMRGGGSVTRCPEVREKHRSRPSSASGAGRQFKNRPEQVRPTKAGRKRQTNGWLPVGEAFQKEVFTVGEEAPVLRKCFKGVQRDEEVIRVRDTVLLRSGPRKKSLPYVAKISALWEEPESGEMMMSLFWYYRPEHTQGGHNPSMHCENEIFASRHQDENSVACIEDKCYVLTLAQYCRFRALVTSCEEGLRGHTSMVPPPSFDHTLPSPRCLPPDVDPDLVFVCRHVYDFRYGRILKNLQ